MKKTKIICLSTVTLAAAVFGVVISSGNIQRGLVTAEDNSTWTHYASKAATYDLKGVKEYWVNCATHEHQFSAPESSNIVEGSALSQKFIDSLSDDDDRLVNRIREKGISFESNSDLSYIDVTLNSNVKSIEISSDYASQGSKSLKVTIKKADCFSSLSKAFLDELFADSNVVAVNFDAKGSLVTSNFRHRTAAGGNVCYEFNNSGWGLTTNWKTFSFTRAMYEEWGSNSRTFVIGGVNENDVLYIDNVRPVTEALTIQGFECGRLCNEENSSYSGVSLRSISENKEELIVSGDAGYVSGSGCFDYTYKTEGNRSIKFTKQSGYVAISAPYIRNLMAEGDTFSFDLYSTVGVNGTASNKGFIDGFNNATLVANAYHPANKWTTYTLTTSQINDSGRFLILQGSAAGDFYIDNIVINKASDNAYGFERDGLTYDSLTANGEIKYLNNSVDNSLSYFLRVQTNGGVSSYGFSYDVKTEGSRSLRISRTANKEVCIYVSTAFKDALGDKSFSFDIYSTYYMNSNANAQGVTDGNRNVLSINAISDYTWTTLTFTKDNMTSDGRTLIFKGSLLGDIYIDNFVIND